MKALVTISLIFTLFSSAFAGPPEDKTFLILFDKEELKHFKSSPEYISLTFNKIFVTRTYSGNSEAVLLLTIANSDLESCDIGQMLVQVNRNTSLKLEDIAFRIVDLNETKTNYKNILASIEAKPAKKKSRGGISLQAN